MARDELELRPLGAPDAPTLAVLGQPRVLGRVLVSLRTVRPSVEVAPTAPSPIARSHGVVGLDRMALQALARLAVPAGLGGLAVLFAGPLIDQLGQLGCGVLLLHRSGANPGERPA